MFFYRWNCLVAFLIFCSVSLFGQNRIVSWENLDLENNQNFPKAINNNLSISDKVNEFLQSKYLEKEDAWRDTFTSFESSYPTSKICGISISYEHEFNTAPGFMSFTDYHYFNSQTGEHLDLEMFFNEDGLKKFIDIANFSKDSLVSNYKKNLIQSNDLNDQLQQIIAHEFNNSITKKSLKTEYSFQIHNNQFLLVKDWDYAWGVGNHNLPSIFIGVSFEKLSGFMNTYGLQLTSSKPIVVEPRLMHGYIAGKYEISALVRDSSDSVKITYWYKSNMIPINWIGEIYSNNYMLKELDKNSNNRAEIQLKFYLEDKRVIGLGTWSDLKNHKTLSLELFDY